MFAKWLAAAVLVFSTTAFADEIELVSGEVLRGANARCADGRVHMDHPILGHLDIAEDRVLHVRSDTSTDLEAAVATLPATVPGVAPASPAPAKEPEWKFTIELGLNGTNATTRTQDFHAAASALYETPEHRWKFDAMRATSKTDGELTRDQCYVQGLKDWMWEGSPWIAFAFGRYDWDDFQQWERRASVAVGAGYKLIDEDDAKLRARVGFAETREWAGNDDEEENVERDPDAVSDFWRPEALVGLDGSWKFTESQSIEGGVTDYLDLRDSGEYRVVSSLAWSIKLSDADSLSLKIGLEHEFDTHRSDPFKKGSLKYFAAILFAF